MEKMAEFLVKKRTVMLFLFLLLAGINVWLMTMVTVNYDMSQYLPVDSASRQGALIMGEEFPPASTIYLMFEGLGDAALMDVYDTLSGIPYVANVGFEPGSDRHQQGDHTLYIVTIGVDIFSSEGSGVLSTIDHTWSAYDLVVSSAASMPVDIMTLAIPAVIILLVIFIFMAHSWFEPLIFIVNIGVAILLNMGTNAIFDSVSDITISIAAILQLVLSMDYSIIFLDRYRQEKERTPDKYVAMKQTLRNSFATISSISFTTIVGMIMLVFMSFTIGRDLGLVIAKGVFFSMICVFAVMPALILKFDGLMEKTAKPTLPLRMGKVAAFSYRGRFVMLLAFVALFVGAFFLRGGVEITYTVGDYDLVRMTFPQENTLVVLYQNTGEEQVAALAERWAGDARVSRVDSYALTLGQAMPSPEEMATMAQQMPPEMLAEMGAELAELYEAGRRQFLGENFSRLMIHTDLPMESPETFSFVASLRAELARVVGGETYLLGESAMAYEMSRSFPGELDLITILTTIAFFVVAAIAFKSLSVSVLLVLVIQSSVFITMASTYFQEGGIMFLALIIAQCLLKSRIIDYGILYTANYIEARRSLDVKEATAQALNHSIHTIMTSGLIIIAITLVLGILFAGTNDAVSEILLLVARGCAIGVGLTVFILPSLTAVFDRFVCKRKV